MPARSPSPSSVRGIVYGALATLVVAALTAWVRDYDHRKLDVSRFEKDSIASMYERQADRTIILRIDSTTQAILRSRR
jgi:hypothetical protein